MHTRSPRGTLLASIVVGLIVLGLVTWASATRTTQDSGVRFSGPSLPTTERQVKVWQASSALPELDAPQAVQLLAETTPALASKPTSTSPTEVAGSEWRVRVEQSQYATTVRVSNTDCGAPVTAGARVVAGAKGVVDALGDDPGRWGWFSLPAAGTQGAQAIAEPLIEGSPGWSTGLVAATMGERGLCGMNAILMKMAPTSQTVTVMAPATALEAAMSRDVSAFTGSYDRYELTRTLDTQGRLVPGWRFTQDYTSPGRGIIVVDLGDGPEVALDTETLLRDSLAAAREK